VQEASRMIVREHVLKKVRQCVSQKLAVPLADVAESSLLYGDLGADSLDFADIVFAVADTFGIDRELERSYLTRIDFTSPAVVRDGYLSPAAIEQIGCWVPEVLDAEDKTKMTPRDLFALVTVGSIASVVETRLRSLQCATEKR